MTRGGGIKILRGAPKFLDTLKGALKKIVGLGGGSSENLYTSNPTGGGGAPKKLNRQRGRLVKF